MNKFITAVCLSIIFSVAHFAQTGSTDEYKKNEYFVGYSNQQIDGAGRSTFNGLEASYTRSVSRYFGIRGTFSAAFSRRTLAGTLDNPAGGTYSFQQDNNRSVYNFLAGVQIKDNASTKRFKPFGFALAGVAHNRSRFKNLACTSGNCPTSTPLFNNVTFADTGFAAALGGGLDIKISNRIDFRAIQVDYNPIYSNTRVDHNVRFGVGLVFK